MPTISSHVLDAVTGGSAVGVRVDLTRIESDGSRSVVFTCETDDEGRINQTVQVEPDVQARYELEFQTAAYFQAQKMLQTDDEVMDGVVLRIRMTNPEKQRYHFPIMASPHSYSLWWSR
jgi:5-hydroxyisourate hydrolase-like protein (transthyretin family)